MTTGLLEKVWVNPGMARFGIGVAVCLCLFVLKRLLARKRQVDELERLVQFGELVVAGTCRHKTALVGEVRVGTSGKIIDLSKEFADGKVEFCHHCLTNMSPPCAHCGEPIFPFEKVTLYSIPEERLSRLHKGVAIYRTAPQIVAVGCHRKGCVEEPSDLVARWYPPGAIQFSRKAKAVLPELHVMAIADWDGKADLFG